MEGRGEVRVSVVHARGRMRVEKCIVGELGLGVTRVKLRQIKSTK